MYWTCVPATSANHHWNTYTRVRTGANALKCKSWKDRLRHTHTHARTCTHRRSQGTNKSQNVIPGYLWSFNPRQLHWQTIFHSLSVKGWYLHISELCLALVVCVGWQCAFSRKVRAKRMIVGGKKGKLTTQQNLQLERILYKQTHKRMDSVVTPFMDLLDPQPWEPRMMISNPRMQDNPTILWSSTNNQNWRKV